MSHELTFWRRRDFLTRAGFAVAAAALDGCSRGAVQKAIPFVSQPETIVPGVASWYATTCGGCTASCALVVKTRDGRPIKVEGNDRSSIFGGTCATGQATVLSLYDGERLRGPRWHSQPTSWPEVDQEIRRQLDLADSTGGAIVLLSGTITSPSTRALIADWSRAHPTFRHVAYDAVSCDALGRATRACFGVDGLPHYRFDRADRVVSIGADFLGTWLSPVEFTRQYAGRRRPDARAPMSRHVHFEASVSLTGSNADQRIAVAPSAFGRIAVALLSAVAGLAGEQPAFDQVDVGPHQDAIARLAADLWHNRGRSLVVTGSNDFSTNVVVFAINELLGNVGTTLEVDRVSRQKQGDERAMAELVDDMARGRVHVLMVHGVNPAYDFPDRDRFARAMTAVPLTISLADRPDETASLAHAVCPDHHFLEAWNDAEPVSSAYSLAQPTMAPLFDTRGAQDSLLQWLGRDLDYYGYLRAHWREHIAPQHERGEAFDAFWDRTLQDGVFETASPATKAAGFRGDWRTAARDVLRDDSSAATVSSPNALEIHLYEAVAIRDGRHANNPWLQELPDPISKITWGNYVTLNPGTATRFAVRSGDVVRVSAGNAAIELPAHLDGGQAPGTVSIALGYGRERAGKVGTGVGANAFPLTALSAAGRRYVRGGAIVSCTGRRDTLATTQAHQSMESRPIVRQTTLAGFVDNPSSGNSGREELPTLWSERTHGDHQWGLVIDLNACTGCSACVTSCQAENNVPVVGKAEVERGREMHWLRVDTYTNDERGDGTRLVQPMMCQHCQDAPCETVCPVLATVHSSDGLNQQVYNRCVGTRYCENNCPYKVRRFNWFEYARNGRFDFTMNDPVGRMVLNPDVVVRSRGVMEKCSMCIQRIQDGKLAAQQEGRPVRDGDIATACQQACPAQAIVFGDLADPNSRVSQLRRDPRHYHVLEELGTRPHIGYLVKVRNTPLEDERL